ncbi:MAG: CapA family protein [Pyrinomonadaceae bacterium]
MKYIKPLIIIATTAFALALIFACRQAKSEEPVNANQPESAATPKTNVPITIAAVGDIMLGSPFPNDTRMPPNDGADLLKGVTPILSAADIAFGNLEGPMVDSGTSAKCSPGSTKCFAFRVPTRYGKYLKDAGFDVMSLANNHAGDFGDAGRTSTRKVLDELGIKHAGSDRETFSTVYFEAKGRKVAVIGFAHNKLTPNVNDLAFARQLVTAATKKADLVIVSFHGGAEGTDRQHVPNQTEIYVGETRGNLPLFAHTVIDAGADLVLGHGPHVLRGMEIYKDRLIAYSLGNFCTYGWFKLEAETALTAILEARLAPDGKFVGGRIHNGRQQGRGIPVLDNTGDSIRKIRELSLADFGTNAPKIDDNGSIMPK